MEESQRSRIEREINYMKEYAVERFSYNSNALTTFFRTQMWTTITSSRAYATIQDYRRSRSLLVKGVDEASEEPDVDENGRSKFGWRAVGGWASVCLDSLTAILAIMHNYDFNPLSAEIGKLSLDFWRIKGYAQLLSLVGFLPVQMGIEKCRRIDEERLNNNKED
jgi:hypothetical protein